jgi:hypothetical protein
MDIERYRSAHHELVEVPLTRLAKELKMPVSIGLHV